MVPLPVAVSSYTILTCRLQIDHLPLRTPAKERMPGADAPLSDSPAPVRPSGTTTLPAGTLLVGLFIGRLILAIVAVISAGLAWTRRPDQAFLIVVAVLLALVITTYGAWRIIVRHQRAGVAFLMAQSLTDLALVAVLGQYAGPDVPVIIALYVLVIAMYALLLPLRPGIIMVLAGVASYALAVSRGQPGALGPGFWGQVGVFIAIYGTVAYLGTLLRSAEEGQTALETELQRVRLEAEDILEHISAGVLTVDGQGRLGFINPTAEELLGLERQALMRGSVLETLGERSPELLAAIQTGITEGRRLSRAEGTVSRPDGRRFPIGLSTTTFNRTDELLPVVTAIFSDISDLQRLHDLHLRAERLEAVAELSASLAHEIRNPLASIRSSVEQLARSSQADADDRFLGQLIIRESDRLSRLLTEFLDFSRVRVASFEPVDLHGLVLQAVQVVRKHPDCTDRVRIEVAGVATALDADADLLHRVVVNLVLNAVQALSSAGTGGLVRVSVDSPPNEGLPLGRDFERPVRLRVMDDGPGIDPELKPRLFEPFVSGRPGGSGLGLAIVERAVEAHGGLVFVDSAPDAGTTFTIYLHSRRSAQETP